MTKTCLGQGEEEIQLMLNLDIKTAVQVAFFLSVLGIILGVVLGVRSIREGRKLLYFRKRQDLIAKGW